jgi:hypothetical protein
VIGAAQYADVPLGFFFLATLVLICMRERTAVGKNGFLSLAGIMAGLAAWTKNEGLLFLVSLLVAHFAANFSRKDRKACFRELAVFAAGALPIFAVLIYFKLEVATYNDLFSQPGTVFDRLVDLSRYRTILKTLLSDIFNFGAWFVSIPPCIAFYLLFIGRRGRSHSQMIAGYITLGLMAAGYFVIYLIAPLPLDWLLASSMNRLLIQLWPSVLFLMFLWARTPEEVIAPASE